MSDEEYRQLRQKFTKAMEDNGWHPLFDNFGSVHSWEYKSGYKIEDGNAFRFWKMSGMTPVAW